MLIFSKEIHKNQTVAETGQVASTRNEKTHGTANAGIQPTKPSVVAEERVAEN